MTDNISGTTGNHSPSATQEPTSARGGGAPRKELPNHTSRATSMRFGIVLRLERKRRQPSGISTPAHRPIATAEET
jgi:hypothetical protein